MRELISFVPCHLRLIVQLDAIVNNYKTSVNISFIKIPQSFNVCFVTFIVIYEMICFQRYFGFRVISSEVILLVFLIWSPFADIQFFQIFCTFCFWIKVGQRYQFQICLNPSPDVSLAQSSIIMQFSHHYSNNNQKQQRITTQIIRTAISYIWNQLNSTCWNW